MSEPEEKKTEPKVATCVRCGLVETWTPEEVRQGKEFQIHYCEIKAGAFDAIEADLCLDCEEDLRALVEKFLAEKIERPRKNILV